MKIAVALTCMVLLAAARAQSVAQYIAHTFCGQVVNVACADGSGPIGDLIQASDGNLYGVTHSGGAGNSGTVFSIAPGGVTTTVYSFCAKAACVDGEQPEAGVIEGTDGNLYGTTRLGGLAGLGTIFRLTRGGALTVLHSFCSQTGCADGQWPHAALIQDSAGNLYGTAQYGGAHSAGTAFELSAAGAFTVLHTFCSAALCADGALPAGGLTIGAGGILYGTTQGSLNGGTIFKLTTGGALTTLHTFCTVANCPDGKGPIGRLVQAADGNFYGVTEFGGGNSSGGTVFRFSSSGQFSSVYSFCSLGGCGDGFLPQAGLLVASDDNLYGSTSAGGEAAAGTLFRVTTGGTVSTIASFCLQAVCADGYYPAAGLVQASNGDVYGTTLGGGQQYAGIAFGVHETPAAAGPITISASTLTVSVGAPVTLRWSTRNAFSAGMQVCEAYLNGAPYMAAPSSGSVVFTPTAAGSYSLALTCGGIESGLLTLSARN